MKLSVKELRPYKSLLLLHSDTAEASLKPFWEWLSKEIVASKSTKRTTRSSVEPRKSDGLFVAALHYEEGVPASWTSDVSVIDRLQQLVVVVARSKHLVVFSSNPKVRDWIRQQVLDSQVAACQGMRLVSEGKLNAAFLKDKPTAAMWLSGTHRRTPSKVDSKVVSGVDLRYALDPLADQSFMFTAAKTLAEIGSTKERVGVTPAKSSIWTGTSEDWTDFTDFVKRLIDTLEANHKDVAAPYAVLAVAQSNIDLAGVGDCYDAALIPPEVHDDVLEPDVKVDYECMWSHILTPVSTVFNANTLVVTMQVTVVGQSQLVGTLKVAVTASQTIRVHASAISPTNPDLDNLVDVLKRHKRCLKLWFNTGRTLSDLRIFEGRYRDLPFKHWDWHDLGSTNIIQEKPESGAGKSRVFDASKIGSASTLFCWITNHFNTGWLACNDGSMEVADFIHVSKDKTPVLTLIHAKGANSDSAGRQICLSPFELVVGQAVKNLRHVDELLLEKRFSEHLDKRVKAKVWEDSKVVPRDRMQKHIGGLGTDIVKRVVVLQPHVSKAMVDDSNVNSHAMRQLNSLLNAANLACVACGAEFTVWGPLKS